jgi:aspartyl-tRNA(Asn)/glutamyl-tRNA(Gln) amidotransferase subunit A
MLQDIDALLLPVSPCEAPRVDGRGQVNGRNVAFGAVSVPMRGPINVTGLPAIAVPVGFGPSGLPLSMQIVGPRWGEATVLRVAHAYEQATAELRSRRPPID